MLRFLIFSVLSIGMLQALHASHLVGGDITYDCMGNNQYRIRLNVYRDCFATGPNVANFDDPAFIAVYEGSAILTTQSIFLQTRTNIPPVINNPCLQAPPNVCVEEGYYEFVINLMPNASGYKIVYQRCCRNQTIVNLNQPGNQGATFFVDIPPASVVSCNSSPRFNAFPPIAICANDPLVFDHSATDPDSDNIVYELCAPSDGGSQTLPQPNPPSAPPYANIQYQGGFSATSPLNASPSLSIDPNTGIITGTPNGIGQYVVGVCANEYRNGTLIGTIKRDFQFNVTDCRSNVSAAIPVIDTNPSASLGTAGVFVYECQDLTVNFKNTSINGTTFNWDFGVTGTSTDVSTAFEPNYTYPDTGVYIVKLVVNKGYPCSDSTEVVVRIYPVFNTDFSFSDICENETAEFLDLTQSTHGFINSWEWNFGDGNISTLSNPMHNYNREGSYTVKLISKNSKGCRDERTKQIDIHETPNTQFNHTAACINQNIRFTNTTSMNTGTINALYWEFSNGQNDNQNTTLQKFNSLGNHTATLFTESNLGCKDTLTKTFFVNPLPIVTSSPDTSICEGEEIVLTATGGVNYIWLPDFYLNTPYQNTTLANPQVSLEYIVLVKDVNGCSDTSTTKITVFPKPNTSAGNDTFLCFGDSITLSASGGLNFEWFPANLFQNNLEIAPTITADSSIYISLKSESDMGCINYDTIYLEVQNEINKPLEILDQSVCFGDSIQFDIPYEKYIEWKPSDLFTSSNSNNTNFIGSESTYVVLNISNDCYMDSFQFFINVTPLPEVLASPSIDTIFRNETATINVKGANDYEWLPIEGVNNSNSSNSFITVEPLNTTRYYVKGIDSKGCYSYDTTIIHVEVKTLIVVPSAFSPNKDGLNDYFKIIKTLNIATLRSFEIFNRWGERVFSTNNINSFWDGTYKGEKQEMGVYVFKISAITFDGDEIIKYGNLTLLK